MNVDHVCCTYIILYAYVEEYVDTISNLQKQSKENGTVVLHKLSKTFDTTTAVRELSLTMDNGR